MARLFKIAAFSVFLLISQAHAQRYLSNPSELQNLRESHDIQSGDWGPYSKQYAGISHIPDMASGMRFDFFIAPGYYRNKVLLPNVLFESGYYPWFADMQTGRYIYRYELEWKDKVYTDVSYRVIDKKTVFVEIKCINRTQAPQNLAINLMGTLNYPEIWPEKKIIMPLGSVWVNAVDYTALSFSRGQAKDNLVTDGLMKGEVRGNAFIEGSALGKGFGKNAGEVVRYKIPEKIKKGVLSIVYRLPKNSSARFSSSEIPGGKVSLEGTGALSTIKVSYDSKGASEIQLLSLGGNEVEINGLLFSPVDGEDLKLENNPKMIKPERILADAKNHGVFLKYQNIPGYYGIRWEEDSFKIREIENDELDVYFRKMVHNHVDSILKGNGKGHFENVFIRPVELPPLGEKTIRCLLTYDKDAGVVKQGIENFAALTERFQQPAGHKQVLEAGNKYLFSQGMLKAALLSNMVYPIYTQRKYIRHFTHGKWWNSLYTWDSGFIALGLNEVDLNKAIESINAYTTPPGSQSAFIHHGSLVPGQVYAFLDLMNKSQSKETLNYLYPRLKQYYTFLSGKLGSSTTAKMGSGLLNTWDYFYNSGGWDDYPAQVGVHTQKLESSVSPVITTAQCIRFAKILRMAAKQSGNSSDVSTYDKDIQKFSLALQRYSWNPSSGYFSYVSHDASGKPTGPFQFADGSDFNMGLDGAYPLIAGICTSDQERILINKIFSPLHMWTPNGISVVDQSAPYYRKDGYWNGSVWMPHQWFMWKTMLDLGRADLALKISEKALQVFSKETDNSYYTFEHYLAESGRGAGWHQFSGLSTPVLSFFNASYQPGTLTTGFEIWLARNKFNGDFSAYEGDLIFDEATLPHPRSIMVCLNPKNSYLVYFDGKELKFSQPYPGLLLVNLPAGNHQGKLIVKPKLSSKIK
jgi:hypothetical protein